MSIAQQVFHRNLIGFELRTTGTGVCLIGPSAVSVAGISYPRSVSLSVR